MLIIASDTIKMFSKELPILLWLIIFINLVGNWDWYRLLVKFERARWALIWKFFGIDVFKVKIHPRFFNKVVWCRNLNTLIVNNKLRCVSWESFQQRKMAFWVLLSHIELSWEMRQHFTILINHSYLVTLILAHRYLNCDPLIKGHEKHWCLGLVIVPVSKKVEPGQIRFSKIKHENSIKLN